MIPKKIIWVVGKDKQLPFFLVPFVFTFASALFGLVAVIKSVEGEYVFAAYCIMSAVAMDFFDGRLARALGSTSRLGMELDSLCDAISFCFAPVVVLYLWKLHEYGFLGLIVLIFYLCAGLFRLARFNAASSEHVPTFFVGVPTTLSAFFLVQLITNELWLAKIYNGFFLRSYMLMCIITGLALLMCSQLPFPTLKSLSPSHYGVKIFGSIIFCLAIGSFIYSYPFVLVFLFMYITLGLLISPFFRIA